jgi:hypothetical protein
MDLGIAVSKISTMKQFAHVTVDIKLVVVGRVDRREKKGSTTTNSLGVK